LIEVKYKIKQRSNTHTVSLF